MTPERSDAGPMEKEVHAASIINEGLQTEVTTSGGSISLTNFANTIETAAEMAPEDVQRLVSQYVTSFQSSTHGAVVSTLPEGIGGQFNGSQISIATTTMEVTPHGLTSTIEQIGETLRHEAYHQMNAHTEELIVGGSAEGDTAVTIGNVEFAQVELIEGLTVLDTGADFVSNQYIDYRDTLQSAVASSSISMDDVRRAVNQKKDLRGIDDSVTKQLAI